uniref:Derlin n=1 Tax=Strongyloides venezuelensis TaxID=75913 RepID=A0A0K0EVW5_STRVS
MSDFRTFYESIPKITRYWMTGSVVMPLLGRIGIISPASMYLNWPDIYENFHIWRPLTALFYYPLTPATGFNWLLMMYFMYNYSKTVENDLFTRRPAEYLFMLIFLWISSVGIALAFGIYFLLEPMVLAVLYYWAQNNKDTIVSFWFGSRFKAMYLPWVLLGFNMILRGGGLNELAGIIVGHIFYFATIEYPLQHGGRPLLECPQFLKSYFPDEIGGYQSMNGPRVSGGGARPFSDNNQAPRTHDWGSGRTLGSD